MPKAKLFARLFPHDPDYEEFKIVRHRGVWKLKGMKYGFFFDCIHLDIRFNRKVAESVILKSGLHEVK